MLHACSTASRQPAIPAVGFLDGALVRPHVPGLVPSACGSVRASFGEARDPIVYLRTDDRHRARLPKWLDYAAAAFIVTAVTFGPALTWLLGR